MMFGNNDYQRKLAAWNAAHRLIGRDPAVYRRDDYGTIIKWDQYGDRTALFGWEIDHRIPTILGGGDGRGNLRALHWRNNASLGGALGQIRS